MNLFSFSPRPNEPNERTIPTLAKQCSNAVSRLVCAAVSRVRYSNADMKVVRRADWMEAKALIHVSLSDKCIEEIYSTIFLKDCTVPRGVVTHSGLSRMELCEHEPKKTLNTKLLSEFEMSTKVEKIFILWWLLSDPYRNKDRNIPDIGLGHDFNLKLMSFLESNDHEKQGQIFYSAKKEWERRLGGGDLSDQDVEADDNDDYSLKFETVTVSMNFIMRRCYLRALMNLPHLRKVKIERTINNGVLSLLVESCKGMLETIEFSNIHMAGQVRLPGDNDSNSLEMLFRSQQETLTTLDLRDIQQIYTMFESSDIFDALAMCRRLQCLRTYENHLTSEMARVPSLERLLIQGQPEGLGINDPTVGETDLSCLSFLRNKFPSLKNLKMFQFAVRPCQMNLLRSVGDILSVLDISVAVPVQQILTACPNLRHLLIIGTLLVSPGNTGEPPPKKNKLEEEDVWTSKRFCHNLLTFDYAYRIMDEEALRVLLLRCRELREIRLRIKSFSPEMEWNKLAEDLEADQDTLCSLRKVKLDVTSDRQPLDWRLIATILERSRRTLEDLGGEFTVNNRAVVMKKAQQLGYRGFSYAGDGSTHMSA